MFRTTWPTPAVLLPDQPRCTVCCSRASSQDSGTRPKMLTSRPDVKSLGTGNRSLKTASHITAGYLPRADYGIAPN